VVKSQFAYRNEDSIEGCDQANKLTSDWLIWYKTKQYHGGLNYQIDFTFVVGLNQKESNVSKEGK
jgi:hypothetical protein